jgi:hypothetical protein
MGEEGSTEKNTGVAATRVVSASTVKTSKLARSALVAAECATAPGFDLFVIVIWFIIYPP